MLSSFGLWHLNVLTAGVACKLFAILFAHFVIIRTITDPLINSITITKNVTEPHVHGAAVTQERKTSYCGEKKMFSENTTGALRALSFRVC